MTSCCILKGTFRYFFSESVAKQQRFGLSGFSGIATLKLGRKSGGGGHVLFKAGEKKENATAASAATPH